MEESESELSDSDSNDDDDNSVPSITGNYDVDEAIFNYPERFQNSFYYPLSTDGERQTGIPFETLTQDVDKNATLRVYPTSTGLFVIEQKLNELHNKHQRAQICRNILCALDQLTSLHFPQNYQDFIIRQVVGQDYYPMPLYFGPNGNESDLDGDESDDFHGNYTFRFLERLQKRKRSS